MAFEPTAKQEWDRLLLYAEHITWFEVAAGPPHRAEWGSVWVVDVPDWVASYFEGRVAPLIFTHADQMKPGEKVAHRAEWDASAIILPVDDSITLPTPIILGGAGFSSVCVEVAIHATKQGYSVFGRISYPSSDQNALNGLEAVGWMVKPVPVWQQRLLNLLLNLKVGSIGRTLLQQRVDAIRLAS
jgi:hypothetical protein